MPQTQSDDKSKPLADRLGDFLRRYYSEEIKELAQHYPKESRSLEVDYDDVYTFDPTIADDVLSQPEQLQRYLEEALRVYDLPIDISLGQAHVRVHNLPPEYTYYPGEFSPSKHLGSYRGIRGEVTKATDVYPKVEEAAFECKLCGTLNRIPQSDSDFQEPHECQGCERQGPFRVNFDQSEFVDAQKLRIKVPPELADGAGQKIDAFVEDDICGEATIGDRVVVSGTIHFNQETSGNKKKAKFDPYLEGEHISIEETDQQDLDVSAEERSRIEDLANGAEGPPLEVAAESLSTKVFGYDTEKMALILAMVSGDRVEYADGDSDRSNIHVLLIGDPGTAKSKLIARAQDLGWRTVGVTSRRATGPGLTVAAEQDDFGDGDWTLKAGAFVKANGGTVCVDELDDMKPDVRASMLEPMSNQKINASLAGETATFQTEAAVIAAGNPRDGRFDPYEPIPDQFDFRSDLLSRFDLIFTVQDVPDQDDDREIADHVLDSRDAAKRDEQGLEVNDEIEPPVDPEIFRKWIAVAKQQPAPPFASDSVKETLRSSFLELRRLYDVKDNSPVPVTFRKLEDVVRVAEAIAKFELSEVITERHARICTEIVGSSMEDIGKNEDGEFDADVVESGSSKSQKDRMRVIRDFICDAQDEAEDSMVAIDSVTSSLEDSHDYDPHRVESDITKMMNKHGTAIEPQTGYVRFIGGR
ncbi:MCM / cell division control protein 21 [Halostagnicola larsenii XH-48]|uniref:DNA helicase n=1 Tax=Halostagnicola larsenii XH-48 TaxID=797299 RepID=W0JL10_9EURY|nr:minichromosome maintenance protein MCM [Halostagnicola larsenii]AHF99425.1 MCM / cell division control protein 21 [Halostagnicola larsenii XH-48]AHF99436.1 MCM / cell division control protein 21 [Halostagnicola larsenii XH-48]